MQISIFHPAFLCFECSFLKIYSENIWTGMLIPRESSHLALASLGLSDSLEMPQGSSHLPALALPLLQSFFKVLPGSLCSSLVDPMYCFVSSRLGELLILAPFLPLGHRLADFFCAGLDSKYLGLCGYTVYHSYSAQPLYCESSHRYINEWISLYSQKTLFRILKLNFICFFQFFPM